MPPAPMTRSIRLEVNPVSARNLTPPALEAWLARYEEAWEQRDPARAATLFTENAAYHELPFDAPKAGRSGIRDYWASVTADQRNVDFQWQVVAVNGQTGVARWSAKLTSASSGTRVELDGIFVLTFEDGGLLCSELREWWHVKTGP
jgi:uncharacterized protein (TIGR02246 family)